MIPRNQSSCGQPPVFTVAASRPRCVIRNASGPCNSPMRTQSCTLLVMPKTVPVREFRSHLADLLDEVVDRREHVIITRHGRPSAVVIPINEYEALEETAEVLSDDDTLVAIRRGLGDLAAGDEVTLDEVRQEMANRERA